MVDWYCFQCKEKMVAEEVEASYMEILSFIDGLKCPTCGTIYLSEDYVVETISTAEEEIEAKMG
ncbi:MAG: hypothetical protein WC560_08900 [Syntrophales bacterium]